MKTVNAWNQLASSNINHEATAWRLQQAGLPEGSFQARRPDFLVISPPKTGSTWLAKNLGCHPEIFIPEIKEIKYFSSWFKWFDLDWYLEHFTLAPGKSKGEASPTYAILPTQKIQLIRNLFPEIKLIYLMREPIGRAWSHARHNHHYREANFARRKAPLNCVTEIQWQENFVHDWPLTSGDYLGQLKRWLSVFPKDQFFIGFFESITQRPEALLRRLFRFLGVDDSISLSGFPVYQRIQPGVPLTITESQRDRLRQILHPRTAELAEFLRRELDLEVPSEWDATLAPFESPAGTAQVNFPDEWDDEFLKWVNREEESFPAATKSLIEDYRGFQIVFHNARFFALSEALGGICPALLNSADIERHEWEGKCFVAGSLAGVKECVNRRIHEQSRLQVAELAKLRSEIAETRDRLARVELAFAQSGVEARTTQKEPGWLRSLWRKLRSLASPPGRERESDAITDGLSV
jgi:hypothetical protein